MAITKRDNGPARWAVLLASGMAAAGFFGAIINGPQPVQAGPNQAGPTRVAVVQPTQVPTPVPNRTPRQRITSPSIAQAPQFLPAPRLRTRGS